MISKAAISMQEAMSEIRAACISEGERRGKRATGRTFSTLSTFVTQSQNSVVGTLEGEEQWRFVGNGRGPGGMPPVQNIQRWIDAKGLSISAWAVARSMARRGSKDYRNRAPNVFESGFEDWTKNRLGALEDKVAGTYTEQVLETAVTNLKKR